MMYYTLDFSPVIAHNETLLRGPLVPAQCKFSLTTHIL
jgi:hypothetical protein